MDKSDINKLKTGPFTLHNLKSKVDKIGVGKIELVSGSLNKFSDVIKIRLLRKQCPIK